MRVFNETQKFSQSWLRVVLIGIAVLTMLPVLLMSDWKRMGVSEVIIVTGAMALTLFIVFFILFVFRLESRIDETGVTYGFFPIPGKLNHLNWDEIEKIYIRKYSPIGDYGGWGYRINFNKSKGKAYNVQGNIGIQMELKSGKRILIGTQKKEEAESALRYYTQKEDYGTH